MDTAPQTPVQHKKAQKATVLSDTPAGVITTDHMEELETLRDLVKAADRLSHRAWIRAFMYPHTQGRYQAEMFNPFAIQGHQRVFARLDSVEVERLSIIYEDPKLKKATSYDKTGLVCGSIMTAEMREKQGGEEAQARKVIEELDELRRQFVVGGKYFPIVQMCPDYTGSPVSMKRPRFHTDPAPDDDAPPAKRMSMPSASTNPHSRPPGGRQSSPIEAKVIDINSSNGSEAESVEASLVV